MHFDFSLSPNQCIFFCASIKRAICKYKFILYFCKIWTTYLRMKFSVKKIYLDVCYNLHIDFIDGYIDFCIFKYTFKINLRLNSCVCSMPAFFCQNDLLKKMSIHISKQNLFCFFLEFFTFFYFVNLKMFFPGMMNWFFGKYV